MAGLAADLTPLWGGCGGIPSSCAVDQHDWLGCTAAYDSGQGKQGARAYTPGISTGAVAGLRAFFLGNTRHCPISQIVITEPDTEGWRLSLPQISTKAVVGWVLDLWVGWAGRSCVHVLLSDPLPQEWSNGAMEQLTFAM
jgi:hypothetical protein